MSNIKDASGRFNEIINIARDTEGCTYRTLNCNAENFVERAAAAGLAYGSAPRRGAIMCWQKGSLSSGDGAGHVAIVEAVYSNNSVYTSESAYGGTAFYNSSRTNDNGRWGMGSAYSFRCFIYLPDDVQRKIDGGGPTPPSPSGKFNIGDRVIVDGPLYTSSNASYPAGSVSNRETNITRRIDGAMHPYNTTGDLGWMDESSIRAVEPTPPGPEWPKSYTVVSGDTLSGIAEKFYGNGDYNHYMCIANANGISNPSLIYPGQVLTIPEYTEPAPQPTPGFNVGDRVEITGKYASSAYSKSARNSVAVGWTRYITAIYADGRYPYQLGANPGDTSSGNTTGFADANSIRKI